MHINTGYISIIAFVLRVCSIINQDSSILYCVTLHRIQSHYDLILKHSVPYRATLMATPPFRFCVFPKCERLLMLKPGVNIYESC